MLSSQRRAIHIPNRHVELSQPMLELREFGLPSLWLSQTHPEPSSRAMRWGMQKKKLLSLLGEP